MKTYLFCSVQIINADGAFVGDVLIGEGKILDICRGQACLSPTDVIIIDGKNKLLLPGLIDAHVHFRDPGLTQKEDFTSGSCSAIAGGITTFFDMPNTIPPTFTLELLEKKRALACEKSFANFGLFLGAGMDNLKSIQEAKNIPGIKLYLNETTGDLKLNDESVWRKIFRIGRRVVLHAEGDTFVRAVQIWREENCPCHLHLAHASRKEEIDLVRKMKKDPYAKEKISCEVCPHHLLLSEGNISCIRNLALVKPRIGTKEDQRALWEGIEDGTVDTLATDHAPHTKEEKKKGAYGIPGTETLLPLMMTEFQKRNISLMRFAEMTSKRVVELFGIQDKKGQIEEDFDADVVLVRPELNKINPEKFFSKAKFSPFRGWKVDFKVEKTFISGELVFDRGKFVNEKFRGREVVFNEEYRMKNGE